MPLRYIANGPPTAYTFAISLGEDHAGRKVFRVFRWNCWGEKRDLPNGYYDYATWGEAPKLGWDNLVTMQMLKMGCCPPMLKQETVGEQDLPLRTGGAVEEAIKLHKRGYLGGGG